MYVRTGGNPTQRCGLPRRGAAQRPSGSCPKSAAILARDAISGRRSGYPAPSARRIHRCAARARPCRPCRPSRPTRAQMHDVTNRRRSRARRALPILRSWLLLAAPSPLVDAHASVSSPSGVERLVSSERERNCIRILSQTTSRLKYICTAVSPKLRHLDIA